MTAPSNKLPHEGKNALGGVRWGFSTSPQELRQQQVALVEDFAKEKFLRLNLSKCEIVLFSRDKSTALPICEVDGSILPAGVAGKCLGYWWKGDLLAMKCVEENILKAHHAFSTMKVLVCSRVILVPFRPGQCWRHASCQSCYMVVRTG